MILEEPKRSIAALTTSLAILETVMRHRMIAAASIICLLVFTGCSSLTPTAPAALIPNGFGVIVESGTSPMTSFGACLSGSALSSCFSASRLHAGNVTGAAATAPSVPLNLVASANGSSVTLTWVAPNSGDPATAYVIEAGSASGLANLANFSTGNTLTVFQAAGVGAGTYFVRVRAANGFGASAPSNEAVLVVSGSGVPPGAPTGLTNTMNSGGTVGFAWNAASGGPTSYIIEAGSQIGLANLANTDLGSTATTMTATGVGAGTYYVRVRAKNASGISGPSNEVVVTVGAPGCSPSLSPTAANFVGTFVGAIPVGPSSGLTGAFSVHRLSGSDVSFEGSYTDSAGRQGYVIAGLFSMQPTSPRVSFSFVPVGLAVDRDGAMFIGDPSVCSGNVVLVFAGSAYVGYIGSRACQPGESCLPGGIHLRGLGYPMTLTRQ